jgi:3-keto-5-aminohexanoate cleavage enzyme
MDDLVITVAADSAHSYPANPHFPEEQGDLSLAGQYVDAAAAGAAICHVHGAATFRDDSPKPAPDVDAWVALTEAIRAAAPGVIVQNGIGGMLPADKRALYERQRPEMMSVILGPKDARFRRDPGHDGHFDLYGVATREELVEVCADAREHGVELELEAYTTGPYWIMRWLIERELLSAPHWVTLALGFEGACWTPPTVDALAFMVANLPAGSNWSISVMDPGTAGTLIAATVAMGGHVRVGWEDNPFLPSGEIAEHNAQLVEEVVAIARRLGRDVASPATAREIIGLPARAAGAGA